MMEQYPPINGVSPEKMYALYVPRDDDREFPGVTDAETHQMRAVYKFEETTVNIFPEFTEKDDGQWVPQWRFEVLDGNFGGNKKSDVGFESVNDVVQHIKTSISKLE